MTQRKYMINKRSFARPVSSGSRTPSRFGPARASTGARSSRPSYGSGRFNNSRPKFGSRSKSGGKGRGDRIDFSRFIQKGAHVEEKPYVSKHTFADFPFNPQLHKN